MSHHGETPVRAGLLGSYTKMFAGSPRELRISEILIWALLMVFSACSLVIWTVMFVAVEPPVFWTYPVAGRGVAFFVLVVLAVFSISSRSFILTLGGLVTFATFGNVDGVLVEIFGQVDRFSVVLSALIPLQRMQALSLSVIFISLIWVVISSIAQVIGNRARKRVDAWVDSRRHAIFGAEDDDADSPRRISVLAVLALVFSFSIPLAGLVLAYAARNDFVLSNPRKSGLDLAISATIISWFGIGLQGLVLALFVASSALGIGFFELLSGFIPDFS